MARILERGIIIAKEVWLHKLYLFFFCFACKFYQLKRMNKFRKSIESWSHSYFTVTSFTIQFQKQQDKLNLSIWSDLFLE